MADLEKLVVSLQADLKQYEQQLAKAQALSVSKLRSIERQAATSAKKIENSFGRMGSAIKGSIVGALSVATFMRVADAISEAVKAIADLSEEAQKAGVSVEELQRITYAAVQAGLEQEQVVALFGRFNRVLAEAKAKGMAVGNNVDEFLKVADAVANASSAAERARIAFDNFGKAGITALPLLIQGGEQLRKTMAEANVATDALAQAADEFYDGWAATIHNWGTLFNSTIASVLVNLSLIGKSASEMSVAQMKVQLEQFKSSLAGMEAVNFFGFSQAAVDDLKAKIGELGRAILAAQREAAKLGETPPVGEKTPGEASKPLKETADAAKKLQDRIGDLNTEIEKTPDPDVENWIAAMDDLRDAFKDSFGELAVAAADGKLKLSEVMSVVESLRDKLIRMAAEKIFSIIFGSETDAGLISGLLEGRASGGHVNKGQPYVVGESGRELFVPSSSGKIVPASGGGNVAPIINVINQGDIQSTQRTTQTNGRSVTEIVNRAIESRFPDLLNRNAPLIGARPIAKRTS